MIYKTLHRKLKNRVPRTLLKPGVNTCVPKGYTFPAPHVTPVVFLLLQTRQKEHMSFVTHIFRNDQHWSWWRPLNIRSDDFNLTIKNPGLEALLLAAILYQGNHDRNHNLWNIASTEIYILHFQVLLECCYIQRESSQWEN